MFDLSEKNALVTGAAGGIGEAIARALHQQGAAVALAGRDVEKMNALDELGGNVCVLTSGDLSDPDVPTIWAQEARDKLGSVDILINNAGLTRDTLTLAMKDSDWEGVLSINLTASFRLVRACLRGMMKKRFGRIIGITSIVGMMGNAGQANYAASKAGMIGFSKSLAQEVASRGITANCIAPGFIKTAMTDKLSDEQRELLLRQIPIKRLGAPEDVATAAIWLASDEAAWVTGQTIHVNGGMAMY